MLRSLPGVSVLDKTEHIWLRGDNYDDVDASLRSLLGAQRFFVLPNRDLVPVGRTVPTSRLPEGEWLPIAKFFALALPPTLLAGRPQEGSQIPLTIVRPANQQTRRMNRSTPNMLLLDFQDWHAYAVIAPAIRLRQTSFAVTDAYTLVRGIPVPSLPGVRYQLEQNVALPVGWELSVNVDPASARRAIGLKENEIGVFHTDGSWNKSLESDFVATTRSAVRLTQAAAMP